MEIIIVPSPEEGARFASLYFKRQLTQKPNSVLGLATGQTPLPLYRELLRLHQRENLSFAQVTTFNLDEYVGISPEHPGSYHFFMRHHLFEHLDLLPQNCHLPNGLSTEIEAHCHEYELKIKAAGGIDLQVLGIGIDGHIGFNEPGSSLASRTRIKTLTEATLKTNQPFFKPGEVVPRHVLTMGIGTILESRHALLLAFGKSKAEAIAKTVEGPLSANCPASALQLHPRATIILDEPAASKLKNIHYYREVYENKPDWQRI